MKRPLSTKERIKIGIFRFLIFFQRYKEQKKDIRLKNKRESQPLANSNINIENLGRKTVP